MHHHAHLIALLGAIAAATALPQAPAAAAQTVAKRTCLGEICSVAVSQLISGIVPDGAGPVMFESGLVYSSTYKNCTATFVRSGSGENEPLSRKQLTDKFDEMLNNTDKCATLQPTIGLFSLLPASPPE
ncbi:MAG: hypothetical protein M1832_002675 [Thelocarpon impressellum]|nr:MAG: hypothetical protein M1832_002675 [Thelocarpon impressellum]